MWWRRLYLSGWPWMGTNGNLFGTPNEILGCIKCGEQLDSLRKRLLKNKDFRMVVVCYLVSQ
jgi:hypothetical protein